MVLIHTTTMQETQPDQLASASGGPSSHGDSFAKTVSGLIRRSLNFLGQSFGSSRTVREEDVSNMTIKFLYSQLQAQRTANKAEKQHIQQLLEKVVELEHKLNMELTRRKQAEHDSMILSSRNSSGCFLTKDPPYSNREPSMVTNENMEGATIEWPIKGGMKTRGTIGNFHGDTVSCYASEHHMNQTDGSDVHHSDGEEDLSCLCHQCGYQSRRNCLQLPVDGNRSHLDEHVSATDNRGGHETLKRKEIRGCPDFESCPSEVKTSKVLEIMKENSKDDDHATDFSIPGETSDNEHTSLATQNKPSLYHTLSSDALLRKAMRLWQPTCNTTIGTVDCQFGEGSAFEGANTEISEKCSASVMNSHGSHDGGALDGIMSSPKKMNLGPFSELPICSYSSQQHSLYYDRHTVDLPADGLSLHENILVESRECERNRS